MFTGDDKATIKNLQDAFDACMKAAAESLKGKGGDKQDVIELAMMMFAEFHEQKNALSKRETFNSLIDKIVQQCGFSTQHRNAAVDQVKAAIDDAKRRERPPGMNDDEGEKVPHG